MTSGNADKSDDTEQTERGASDRLIDNQTRRGFIKSSGVLASTAAMGSAGVDSAEASSTSSGTRKFTVHALPVDIVHDRFGLHRPEGAMYVLDENLPEAKQASGVAPDEAFDLIEDTDNADGIDTSVISPLTIRALRGETIEVTLLNHLDRPVSMHQTALPYDVDTSDGLDVGHNDDSTVPPGESRTYQWSAAHEGTHFFYDAVSQAWDSTPDGNPEVINGMARGLYGVVVVEPPGSKWRDPETGGQLRSGVRADVYDARLETWHREFVVFYGDPGEVLKANGGEPTWHNSNEKQTTHDMNYRSVTTGQRLRQRDDCVDCETSVGFYSSWVHGDPGGGDSVYATYVGDPVKIVAVGANLEESHVHHIHGHRWKEIPGQSGSDTIDAQTLMAGSTHETYLTVGHGDGTIEPTMSFAEAFEIGAGSEHGSVGDYLFHCHLFPHYAEGMNSFMRVFDKEQDHLQPLPNNDPKIPAGSDTPGFPEFIPGTKGEVPPVQPYYRSMSQEEKQALDQPKAGAPYTDPEADDPVDNIREYTIYAIEADIAYNDAGDHDPDGEVYVLAEDVEKVRNGDMNPEPLVIRANVGELVKLTIRNELGRPKSLHPHFVRFDQLGSDSMTNGYNYDQTIYPGEEGQFRWYADEEGPIFFHDHITGIEDAMHGTFATIIIEPRGSEHLDPHTGYSIQSGTQAIIKNPNGDDFREFALIYHDFAPLIDDEGNFVNDLREHAQNAGVMAINYRNAPYYRRGPDPDPAYLHSSHVNGDPPTPTLEAYAGDPIRIRNVMAVYEEQHNFGIHGVDVGRVQDEPEDQMAEVIGTSEAYTYTAQTDPDVSTTNPDGLPVEDHLYGSMIADDLWDGMWGVFRQFGAEVDHLHPLPDRGAPSSSISEDELAAMGHPEPHSSPRWKYKGHEGKLLYGSNEDRSLAAGAAARKNANVGDIPPKAPGPGTAGQHDGVREYDVTALQTDIVFNEYGDHDPHGIVFVLDEHIDDVIQGNRHPEPLVLRANEGELVRVNLTNGLPDNPDKDHDHPQMRTRIGNWDVSNRTSLHPVHVTNDVQGSDGATVGFNYDQTIAPGETITYEWLADGPNDGCVLWDMADVRGHRHHGAFGQLVVEPAGSTWTDPETGESIRTGAEAVIQTDSGSFREFALSMSDGRHIVNDDGTCVVPGSPEEEEGGGTGCNQIGDPEDQGYVAINNRSEPFQRRFTRASASQKEVFSSDVHGDPNTPIFEANVGDDVVFRVANTADRARGVSFHLAGHQWKRYSGVDDGPVASPRVGVEFGLTPGKAVSLELLDGAGGVQGGAGDYIYQEMKHRRRLEAGWWGIFRVNE